MSWPQSSEYRDALQHPLRCLHDPDLRRAHPVEVHQGLPCPVSGSTADVYEMHAGHDRWAVKCFTRTPGGLGPRYAVLYADLLESAAPWLVGFQYLDQGIYVRGRWYPVLKMRWCDGVPLDDFTRQADAETLNRLAGIWRDLTEQLRQAGMAHTDLHHRHVRVQADPDGGLRLRLIDYDCLYVPALAGVVSEKKLHPAYQHPQRIWLQAPDPDVVRFGNLVIYTALRCLSLAGPELRQRFDEGLLFRACDFLEPATSALLQELWRSPHLEARYLAGRLLLASQGPLGEVPLLRELGEHHLSDEQCRAVETLLRGDAAGEPRNSVAAPESELSFNLVANSELELSAAAESGPPMSFDLVVDSDPALTLPRAPTTAVLPALKPPPLPRTVPVTSPSLPAPPPLSDYAQSRVRTYRVEAWMPQAIAVMKLEGFVHDLGGKVVASVPGLLRVHLLEKAPEKHKTDSVWSLLGLFRQPQPEPRVLSVVELHMQTHEHRHQSRLRVDVHFYPADDPNAEEMGVWQWRDYCDKTFCELRAFLMHTK